MKLKAAHKIVITVMFAAFIAAVGRAYIANSADEICTIVCANPPSADAFIKCIQDCKEFCR